MRKLKNPFIHLYLTNTRIRKYVKQAALVLVFICVTHFGKAQCQNLELMSTSIGQCQPALFKWVVKNAPAGSSFTWDFGNKPQQGRDTFYAFIQAAGKVSVSVTIKFTDNRICTLTKPNFVEVFAKPIPTFYSSRTKLCNGADTVTYFDVTKNSVKRSWVIEGVNYNNALAKQNHAYIATGIKKLSLIVEDHNGCKAIKEFDTVAIIYKNISLDLVGDHTTGCVSQSIKFKPLLNSQGIKITSYKWTFPGGFPVNQYCDNPDTIKYNTAGIYSPSLEIKTENGCIKTFIKPNYLTFGHKDTLSIKISDTVICKGLSIRVENMDKQLKGVFTWGLPKTASYTTIDKFSCNVTYDKAGKYDVNVSYNYNGCIASKTLINAIRIKDVQAQFISNDYYHCLLPHTVHFTNLSKSDDLGKMKYTWKIFSNNTVVHTSNNTNDSFKLTAEGNYDVWLETKHANGCSDIIKKPNFIRNKKVKPDFDAPYTIGCINQAIQFNQQTNFSSYMAADKFRWTFYDKNNSKILGTFSGESPKFIYPDTGLYTVKLVSDNGIGCKDSIIKNKYIEIVKPKIAFEISNPILCSNEILIGRGASQPSRARFKYSWDLEKINSAFKINVQDSIIRTPLEKVGNYRLVFKHSINNGCVDSIITTSLIKVNGISAQLKLDTFNGCAPLMVKPNLTLTENFHSGNLDNTIACKWYATPSTNVFIKNANSSNPEFTFSVAGEYVITVELTNSTNCKLTLSSNLIFAGIKAAFDVSDYTVCANQEVILTDRSSLKPTAIKWIMGADAHLISEIIGKPNQNKIKFEEEGFYRVGIVANKFNTCFDTAYHTIKVIKVKADFISLEKEIKCAPAYAQIESFSKNADSLFWDFGDGNKAKTTSPLVANIYRQNSDVGAGYTIKLIALSNEGCRDSLIRTNYQKVIGPNPYFEMINTNGCEPLMVKFINKTKDAFIHYINYGDGSPLDSNFSTHTYTLNNEKMDSQNYISTMYSIDSLGCKAIYESPKHIVVKANTKATFTVSDSILCQNQSFSINPNHLLKATDNFYINGFETRRIKLINDSFNFINAGTFKIIKVQKNKNNCFDSASIQIVVNPRPLADFLLLDSTCQNNLINFKSTVNDAIQNFWEINTLFDKAHFIGKNITHIFNTTGNATVKLTTLNSYLCKTSITKSFTITGPESVAAGNLSVVSVIDEGSVKIISNPVTFSHFVSSNHYFHSDSMKIIHQSNQKLSESFTYKTLKKIDTSMCFDMRLVDFCGFESAMGKKHCTIYLNVSSKKAFTNQLNWTPYIGWASNFTYTIYRKSAIQSAFNWIANTSSDITEYVDSNLCDMAYTYKIEAVVNDLHSMSNSAASIPLFNYPNEFSFISNVSVNNDNSIQIKWPISRSSAVNKYTLLKTNLDNTKMLSIDVSSNYFTDFDVKTDRINYIYHVIETDKCGNKSKPSLEGKNIVLSTNSADYKTNAKWNTYKNWKSGVKNYTLQIEKDGQFKSIYSTTNADSFMQHDQKFETIHGPYCYRIMAISGDAKDTSYSNISCVISPSTLFIPNAFSPNGDGINEKFGVKSLFIENNTPFTGRNFSLEIFNRWGEKLFETTDIDSQWDGTYEGKPVQMTVYFYRLKAMGIDNRSYSINGQITLIL